jgi:hypothetical protein
MRSRRMEGAAASVISYSGCRRAFVCAAGWERCRSKFVGNSRKREMGIGSWKRLGERGGGSLAGE